MTAPVHAHRDPTQADVEHVRQLLPDVARITDERLREAVLLTWARQWRKSSWETVEHCPYTAGMEIGERYSLINHTLAGLRISLCIAETLQTLYDVDVDIDRLLAIALLHDVSKLLEVEPGPDGTAVRSSLGNSFPHATLGAVEAHEAGIDDLTCKSIVMHPYHPPHTYAKPACLELLIHTWADHGAADPLTFLRGGTTHLEQRRAFEAVSI